MTDTQKQYNSLPELQNAVRDSISRQYIVAHEDSIRRPVVSDSKTKYVVSPKRSFEAAKAYVGKRIAVLNFANNHSIGGAPFSAGAQEESLCRCSTLFPCLEAMKEDFYQKHIEQFRSGRINHVGNDDLIYTPDVIVFKTDERTDPIEPKMMPRKDWFKVNIITCAAPELRHGPVPANYKDVITSRIRKILDVAAKENNEVLILGAWGCGAFKNPPEIVAQVFHDLLKEYDFETVEFALSREGDTVFSSFFNPDQKENPDKQEKITPLYNRRFTGTVTAPIAPNQVFVFNSYSNGYNKAGTAKAAVKYFGAKPGVGEGPTGQSYAIPSEIPMVQLRAAVCRFIDYAKNHPQLEFLVTPIGVGQIFKRDLIQMSWIFADAIPIENIILPEEFAAILNGDAKSPAYKKEVEKVTTHEMVKQPTPDRVTTLNPNQIFVFGSNLAGSHGAGAADIAYRSFGAIWGQGVGLQGQSYAIPTMQGPVASIKPYVDDFISFASQHPDMEFLVTRIGCGIAGFKDNEIAPLFKAALKLNNVRLPKSFLAVLGA